MAVRHIRRVGENSLLGLWAIDEDAAEVASRYPCLNAAYKETCEMFRYEHRRRERMAVRALIAEMNGGYALDVGYDANGMPLLDDGRCVSISHTKGYAAALLSNHRVGIDIEYRSDRVAKVASRFLRPDEHFSDILSMLVAWSAKEAVYKFYSEQRLGTEEIRIAPFGLDGQKVLSVENLREHTTVEVCFEIEDDYVLTWIA